MRPEGAEVVAVLRGAVRWLREHAVTVWPVLLTTLLVSCWLIPRDAALLAAFLRRTPGSQRAAELLSEVGQFGMSTVLLSAMLAAIGFARSSRRWKDVALACFLAGAVAGIAVSALRPALGRARPHAAVEPGFYWFEFDSDFHSMPSGHVMSNTATVFAAVSLYPPARVPAIAYTAAMGWSRMRLGRHYPGDVLWGAVLGVLMGLAIGGSIRDRRSRAPSSSNGRS